MPPRRGQPLWLTLLAGAGVPALASLAGRAVDADDDGRRAPVRAGRRRRRVGRGDRGRGARVGAVLRRPELPVHAPLHTLRVESGEDVVALARLPGSLVPVGCARRPGVDQRRRAERREEQARVLYGLLARLRAREAAERIIEVAVVDVARVFEFLDVRITVDDPPISRAAVETGPWEPTFVLPLRVGDRDIGRLEARGELPPEDDTVVAPDVRRPTRPGDGGRAHRRGRAPRGAGRAVERGPGRAVRLGDPRPADAPRIDQGVGDQPARRDRGLRRRAASKNCCGRSWRRPTA